MNILILNWRDIKNPRAGGAESLTHEIAKRWVKWGHKVTLISERFSSSSAREILDGVTIIRSGKWWNVHIHAALIYLLKLRHEVDVIIDEVHWFPFFSIFYSRGKTVLLVCEVANQLFFKLFPFPIAIVGRMLEKIYFYLYRTVPVIAISQTTRADLVKEGLDMRRVTVLPMGLTVPPAIRLARKQVTPTLTFIGRLHSLKGIEDAISAFGLIHRLKPSCRFWIIGDGEEDYLKLLKRRVQKLGLTPVTKFFGPVSQSQKFELLSRSHLLLVPSAHEGWGLVVSEAAFVGTPTVAYRAGALQESVQDGQTGVLVRRNTPGELAGEAVGLLEDKSRYRRLQRRGVTVAKRMSWDDTAAAAIRILKLVS
ncbi:MAG: glycosyltransferase family 4 protein [Patescibacteria group bacterium]